MPRVKKPVYLFLKEEFTELEYLELLRTDGRTCITLLTMEMLPEEEKDDAEPGIYTEDNGRTFRIILDVKKITPKILDLVIKDLSQNTGKPWILKGVYDFSVIHSPRNQRKG
jgi:hypothetical protein